MIVHFIICIYIIIRIIVIEIEYSKGKAVENSVVLLLKAEYYHCIIYLTSFSLLSNV